MTRYASQYISAFLVLFVFAACSSRQFTQGDYDDVNKARLLDDKFNETDASLLAEEMINSMAAHPIFADAKIPPVVQVETVHNKTQEHIDTKSITDSVRTALIKTGKVRFANKEDRDTVHEEVDSQQQSGWYRKDKQRKKGKQIGANYILTGDLISNVQEVGSKKLVFYRLTLNLTNLDTGIMEWSEEKPIRKRYEKKSVGF